MLQIRYVGPPCEGYARSGGSSAKWFAKANFTRHSKKRFSRQVARIQPAQITAPPASLINILMVRFPPQPTVHFQPLTKIIVEQDSAPWLIFTCNSAMEELGEKAMLLRDALGPSGVAVMSLIKAGDEAL